MLPGPLAALRASCAAPTAWVNDTNIAFKTDDCFTVGTAKYVYVGTRAQTFALGPCNPTMQRTGCLRESGDYKFTLCP